MNRVLAGVAAGSASVLALTACSSSSTSGHPSVVPGTTSAASTSAAPTPVPPTSSAPTAPPSSAPATGGAGGDLTPSDSTLKVGQSARVAYELDTLSKQTTTLAITLTAIKQGSITDLKNFDLDAASKTGVPFYVTANFKNVGDKTFKPSGIFGSFNALNADQDEVTPLNLIGDFPKCDGLPPDSLAPGKSYTECQVYIAPAGQQVGSVVYDHFTGDLDETKITWTP